MSNKINFFKTSLVLLLFTAIFSIQLSAQNLTSAIELKGMKCSDDGRIFNMKLTGESGRKRYPSMKPKLMFSHSAKANQIY